MKGERRLRALVKAITYKPNCVLTLEREGKHQMVFGVHFWVFDSENPGQMRWVQVYRPFGEKAVKDTPDHILYAEMMTTVATFELHEVYEWFMVNGKQFRNPHPVHPLSGTYDYDLGTEFYNSVMRHYNPTAPTTKPRKYRET